MNKIINKEKVNNMKNNIEENIIKIKNNLGFKVNNKIIIFLQYNNNLIKRKI